jgi:soluble lytic murein transglycosylase-like protein
MPLFFRSTFFLIIFFLPSLLIAFCFEEAGGKYAVSPVLLESIAKTESNLDPKAKNKNRNGSVDIGLMQVNSYWINTFGLDGDRLITDSCYNTMTGARILRQCIDRYGYTWEAVGCYNAVSMDKKKAYSWKIFRQLKAEGIRQQKGELPIAHLPYASSLFFKVRDSRDSSIKEAEQNRGAGEP